jgi:hypothetical protein
MCPVSPNVHAKLKLPHEAIADFCRRWKVERLELFGSAVRDDFAQDSDVDFLYVLSPEGRWALDFVDACDELSAIVGRPVDLVSRKAVERSHNPFRRRSILSEARVIYAA